MPFFFESINVLSNHSGPSNFIFTHKCVETYLNKKLCCKTQMNVNLPRIEKNVKRLYRIKRG